jgi:hypothetical protein
MDKVFASGVVAAILATIFGCASGPPPDEAFQSSAERVAQQRGVAELECPAATAQVLSKETIEEPQGTGWYTPPHKAAYTVDISGCGKRTTYTVSCDDRQKSCAVGAPAAVSSATRQLADELQPGAVKTAQQSGVTELGCETVTTRVLRQETIQEVQGTGWYQPPHRAAYTVDVSGCGKRTAYLIACDSRKKDCVAGRFQEKTANGPPQIADKWQAAAVTEAQKSGATELRCPAATTEVLRQETIQEAQTTGWYDPPHRAVYGIGVSGCGKRSTYLVTCDDWKKKCVVGGASTALK